MSDYLAHSRCRYRRRRKLDKLWTSILSVTCQERCRKRTEFRATEFIHHLCNST